MGFTARVLLAIALVLVDALVFFLPLGALLLAYIIIFNPPWFRDLLTKPEQKQSASQQS